VKCPRIFLDSQFAGNFSLSGNRSELAHASIDRNMPHISHKIFAPQYVSRETWAKISGLGKEQESCLLVMQPNGFLSVY